MEKDETTRSIVQIKTGISVRNWEEQIRACQESGKTVKEWCRDNGVPVGTYYARLRRVREAAITEERNRITSPCSKQKEKPAQSELAKGFTAVLPWHDHRAGV